jgi:hypothetical protein
MEEGIYKAEFTGARVRENVNGKEYIETSWHVIEEDIYADVRLYVTHAAMARTSRALKELGFNGDHIDPDFSVKETELEMTFNIVGDKEYKNWDFAFFKDKDIDSEKAKKLDKRYKKFIEENEDQYEKDAAEEKAETSDDDDDGSTPF